MDNYLEKTHEALFSMLKQIDSLCKKHNIEYFLDGGTLIGAVRHKDFIPWDDDADITMTRDNYEKFVTVAHELSSPLLFVTPEQYNGYFFDFVPRIINLDVPLHKETESDKKMNNYNNRLAVDIFIIDTAPKSERKFKKMVIKQKMLYGYAMAHRCDKHLHKHSFIDSLKIGVLSFIGKFQKLSKVFEKQKKLSVLYRGEDTGKYCVTNTLLKEIGLCYSTEYISETVELPLRGQMFLCPKGYHEILTKMYGDYMTPPSEEERVPIHVKND